MMNKNHGQGQLGKINSRKGDIVLIQKSDECSKSIPEIGLVSLIKLTSKKYQKTLLCTDGCLRSRIHMHVDFLTGGP